MVIFVHTTTAKSSLLFNHRNKKSDGRLTQCSNTLCGGYYTQPEKSSPLELSRIRYFVVRFDHKYGYLCAYHSSKIKFTLQPQKQKSGRRVTQCSNTLCGGYCIQPIKSSPLELSRIRYFVVHFDEKYGYFCANHNSKIKFTLQPQEQKVVGG